MTTEAGTSARLDLRAQVEAVLDGVADPCSVAVHSPMGLREMGLVETVSIDSGSVAVRLRLTSPTCLQVGYFVNEIKTHVGTLEGVTAVEVTHDLGFDWDPSMIAPEAAERRRLKLLAISSAVRGAG
jgi:metal-sulfur cluster biosynthetic enzyme